MPKHHWANRIRSHTSVINAISSRYLPVLPNLLQSLGRLLTRLSGQSSPHHVFQNITAILTLLIPILLKPGCCLGLLVRRLLMDQNGIRDMNSVPAIMGISFAMAFQLLATAEGLHHPHRTI